MAEKLWVAQYMRETDSLKRAKILQAAIAEEGMLPENELRSKILEARHPLQDGRPIDCFIRGLMHLKFMDGGSMGLFGNKRIEKEKQKVYEDWQIDLVKSYGEVGEEVLYQELFNMAKLYIELCHDDSAYRSVFFGLGRMKEDKLTAKIANEFYKLGYAIPARFDMQEELRPFTRGLTDAFCEIFDRDKDLLLRLVAEQKR